MGKYLKRLVSVLLIGLLMGIPVGPPVWAQAPMADSAPPPSQAQLEDLVGRIALYPDDLVAIILPASTYPLQIVQADRFLQKLKQDKNLQPDPSWDESVRNLLNYPEVISMMSQDLEWTEDLGEAVVGQQAEVVKAIQAFRAKAQKAGNLKSDDKQVVVVEKNVIQIVPANPEVIYVPQYQPAQVVVVQSAPPPPVYYPTPYPVYYYPYPPGAAFATGFFLGAATAYACNWNNGHVENNVNINNTSNFQSQRVNAQNQQQVNQARQQAQQRPQQTGAAQTGRGQQGGASQWQSQKKPGQVSQGRTSAGTQPRPGDASGGSRGASGLGDPSRGSNAAADASRGAQSRGGASASTADRSGGSKGASTGPVMQTVGEAAGARAPAPARQIGVVEARVPVRGPAVQAAGGAKPAAAWGAVRRIAGAAARVPVV